MTWRRKLDTVAAWTPLLSGVYLTQVAAGGGFDDLPVLDHVVAALGVALAVAGAGSVLVHRAHRQTERVARSRHPSAGDGVPAWHPEGGAGGHRPLVGLEVYASGVVSLATNVDPQEAAAVLRQVADEVEAGRALP